jgi:hypothetical protein
VVSERNSLCTMQGESTSMHGWVNKSADRGLTKDLRVGECPEFISIASAASATVEY